jgi:tRNA threonylcarbamoyladenosine biosynthesis protein TsaB
MVILALDASTYTGTVAVLRNGDLIAEASVAMRGEREERLMPAVVATLGQSSFSAANIDAVACGAGPGSFTSLRIAAAIAKGMAVAIGIPLLVAPSPLLVVAGAQPPLERGRYVALLDAMRGDVFGMNVEIDDAGSLVTDEEFWLAPRDSVRERAGGGREARTPVGPLESLAILPHARGFGVLVKAGLAREVDVSSWEPDYGRKAEAQVRWEEAHGRKLEAP